MSFNTTRLVKACRKQKQCAWCYEMIEIGEPKIVEAGEWEGDFFTQNLHPECRDAQQQWVSAEHARGEYYVEYPSDTMKRGKPEPK